MNVKRILSLIMVTALIFCLSACGSEENNSTVSNTSSVDLGPTKIVTIGKTTVKEISEKMQAVELKDGLKLSVTKDNSNEQYSSIVYSIVDSENKNLATIAINSDLENKAAIFNFSWDYAENDTALNKQILSCLKAIFPAVWPKYSEDNYKALEQNFKLETDYIDRFVSTDSNVTEASPSTDSYEYVSLSITSKTVIFSIRYPDVVENV